MAKISACPQVSELEKLTTGHLPPPEIDALFAHLEACPPCLHKMQSLRASDTLTDALAEAKTLSDGPDEKIVAGLIERLIRLRAASPAGGAATPKTIIFDCSACGKKLQVNAELAGKKVKCPECAQIVLAPEPPAISRTDSGSAGGSDGSEEAPRVPTDDTPTTADPGEPGPEQTPPPAEELWDFLAPAQQPDEIGRLGPYRVLKVLSTGGMGVVFRAEDQHLERPVALKAMLPSLAASPSAKKRFLREAKSAAAIKHDHIVTIHQVGEDRGAPFLAMEFLEGEPLDQRLKREHKLPVADVLKIGREIAEGLAAAHACGLIHRDIKPANIWLERRGGVVSGGVVSGEEQMSAPLTTHHSPTHHSPSRVKILDFGLARSTDDTAGLTRQGAIVGTPHFMAPEQADSRPVDHRSDLFSLGCVLYRMATGELPFKGNNTMSILSSLALDRPRPPQELDIMLPPELSDLIMQLLAKNPDDRPGNAAKVADILRSLETAPISPAIAPPSPRKPASRRRRLPWAIAAAVVAFAGIGLLAQQIIIRITTEDGKTTELKVPVGSKIDTIPPPLPPIPAGEPLTRMALATNPALIKGVQSWTPETVGHRAGVRVLAFSQDGKWLASGGIDGMVRIWDTATWKLHRPGRRRRRGVHDLGQGR